MKLTDTLHIHTAEDTSHAIFSISFPVLMHKAQTNLPISSPMGIQPGELLAFK